VRILRLGGEFKEYDNCALLSLHLLMWHRQAEVADAHWLAVNEPQHFPTTARGREWRDRRNATVIQGPLACSPESPPSPSGKVRSHSSVSWRSLRSSWLSSTSVTSARAKTSFASRRMSAWTSIPASVGEHDMADGRSGSRDGRSRIDRVIVIEDRPLGSSPNSGDGGTMAGAVFSGVRGSVVREKGRAGACM
jgi:hypothetical protein